jgi:hypothetical protein
MIDPIRVATGELREMGHRNAPTEEPQHRLERGVAALRLPLAEYRNLEFDRSRLAGAQRSSFFMGSGFGAAGDAGDLTSAPARFDSTRSEKPRMIPIATR